METNRIEQMEALETLVQINGRLLGNLPTLIRELSGNRQPDTDSYLKNIVEVIGWEIAVINATSPLLAEADVHMDKEHFNQSVLDLNAAITSGEDIAAADALKDLIPHFETLEAAAREVLA